MVDFDRSISKADLLIIGGGLAGVRAALEARRHQLSVILASKGKSTSDSNSIIASGGFATACHRNDTPEYHIEDTLDGGYGINDRNLVYLICHHALENLETLDAAVGGFPRIDEAFDGDPVPAHRFPRSVRYPNGMPGLMNRLNEKLLADDVSMLENHRIVDLLQDGSGDIIGGLFYDSSTQIFKGIIARKTILATGGCGNLFPVTSNSPLISGDGSAVAIRAGCKLRDMEFIQYTPTAFAAPQHIRGQTINGALLAIDGVQLLNVRNERFMEKYAPETMERSNRAVVSKSIFKEVSSGRGTDAGGVYMDLTSVSLDKIDMLRPGFVKFCLENGLNPSVEFLQTAPSVHTCLGGISVDSELMAKNNLYVVGEAIGGTHGANRLSSNSLCEANVTGWYAVKSAVLSLTKTACEISELTVSEDVIENKIRNSLFQHGDSASAKSTDPVKLAEDLRAVMGEAAGVERSREGLVRGLKKHDELMNAHTHQTFSDTKNREAWLDLRNMFETSRIILLCALAREESRGAHERVDFPEQDNENWLGNIFISKNPVKNNKEKVYEWNFVPVNELERPGE